METKKKNKGPAKRRVEKIDIDDLMKQQMPDKGKDGKLNAKIQKKKSQSFKMEVDWFLFVINISFFFYIIKITVYVIITFYLGNIINKTLNLDKIEYEWELHVILSLTRRDPYNSMPAILKWSFP